MTPLEKKEQLIQMFGIYTKRLEKLYDKFYSSLASLGYTDEVLMGDALFNFDSMPEMTAEVNNIFEDFVQKQMLTYRAGITDGIGLAFLHENTTLQGDSVLSDIAVNQVRETAVQTFLRTRLHVPKGLNLSQLIWNYASQAKSEFEVAMSDVIADGLKTGTSAEELGRKVRGYLKNPDMMYRRYHEKVVMSDGTKKDVAIWRRRVVDEDGKVRFVKEPLEAVGQGHYRSARKNAYRLMRSEINMAYHNANHDRWLQEPFVIGQHIWPSDQHPEEDVCDLLKGDYPKDFLFIGWHPACMDTCTPITLKGEERKEYYRRLAAGEDMSNYESPNAIKDVPQGYKDYVLEHADEIIRADRRGKLPWHFDANREYWEDLANSQSFGGVVDSLKRLFSKNDVQVPGNISISKEQKQEIDNFVAMLRRKGRFYEASMFDSLAQENYQIIESVLGIKRSEPMSFKEADSGKGNKYLGAEGSDENCTIAVLAHEMRLRGFDVTARPCDFKGLWTEVRKNPELLWLSPSRGNTPNLRETYGSAEDMARDISDRANKAGRYHIVYRVKGEPGHILCATRTKDGTLELYDPQRNESPSIEKIARRASSMAVYRVDNMLINPSYATLLASYGE